MGIDSLPLQQARILLSNDDGFDATGLAVLRTAIEASCDDVWVVAPESQQSGAGHSLTLQRPLRIRERGHNTYSIDGTPTDCVMLAVNRIMEGQRPDFVLSGVNCDTNLGEDVTYSGTVAAAIEATLLGIPAIAFSQEMQPDRSEDWSVAQSYLMALTERLIGVGWPSGTLINVNFPAEPHSNPVAVRVVRQGHAKAGDRIAEAHDPRGRPYYWIGEKFLEQDTQGADDIAAIAAGVISVTPIKTDFTDEKALATLSEVLW